MASSNFGNYFQTLRKKYGLSQAALAARAAISPRTIIYWESGQYEPRLMELTNTLKAMGVSEAERVRAVLLLESPRGIKQAREIAEEQAPAELGPMPNLGNLLMTLRLRGGLSAEQAAGGMGVHLTTLRRWERGNGIPSAGDIERLATLLGAHPEEREALKSRQWGTLSLEQQKLSLAEWEEILAAFFTEIQQPGFTLIDLQAMTLRRNLWSLAAQTPEALRLMARLETEYSLWLVGRRRFDEAGRMAQRVLNTVTTRFTPEMFWSHALNVAAIQAVEKPQRVPEQGVRIYRKWLSHFAQSPHRVHVINCMAEYASQAGRYEEALHYVREAERIGWQLCLEHTERWCAVARSRTFTRLGRHDDALRLLPDIPPHGFYPRVLYTYLWANALLAAGEKTAAADYVQQLYTHIADYGSTTYLNKANQLASRL